MKKVNGKIFATVLVVVLLTAGSAFAWGGRDNKNFGPRSQAGGQQWEQRGAGQGMMDCGRGNRMMGRMGGRRSFGPTEGQHMMGSRRGNFGNSGRMGLWASVEIPQEIKDKQAEMGKLSIDMRNEMGKKPIDRTKIEELYKKHLELRNELSGWRFQQKLNMIEKLQK